MDGNGTIVVVGAGAAGMAATIAAARRGAHVVLLEETAVLGGTVTQVLLHTIGGLYDASGAFINTGLPVELANRLFQASPRTSKRRIGRTWTLSVSPEVYGEVVRAWVVNESKITVLYESAITRVEVEDGLVRLVLIESIPSQGTLTLQPTAVIDTTGSAEVVRLIDPALVRDNHRRAAGGLVFQMRGVEPGALTFPKGAELVRTMRRAAHDGILPPECAMAWIDTGVYEDEVYVKLFVPLGDNWRAPEVRVSTTRNAERTRDELVSFLSKLPAFSKARLVRTGKLGIRDGGKIEGEYCLTEADVKGERKFSDAACRCCWPIEYWDPETGVSLEYLRTGAYYEIPLRSLKVRGAKNVWAAGKCLSAEYRAQASARTAGTCWAMGEAAGQAAAEYSQKGDCG